MEKYKIAFFTDLHIGVHQNNERWLDVTYNWAKWFTSELKNKNIDKIIFGGDLFHYRDEINVKTLHFTDKLLDLFDDFDLYMIPGNHDAYYKDNASVHSLYTHGPISSFSSCFSCTFIIANANLLYTILM